MSQREEDCRECTLAACQRVGLYPQLDDPDSQDFLARSTAELVEAAFLTCPIGPPYNDILMTFKQRYRSCLEDKGYKTIRLFLQRLCQEGTQSTWEGFCKFHGSRSRLRKST